MINSTWKRPLNAFFRYCGAVRQQSLKIRTIRSCPRLFELCVRRSESDVRLCKAPEGSGAVMWRFDATFGSSACCAKLWPVSNNLITLSTVYYISVALSHLHVSSFG